jgi:hypothetical protein
MLGRSNNQRGEQFIAPLGDLVRAAVDAGGQPGALETRLGLSSNSLGDPRQIVIAHIPNPIEHNLRPAAADNLGANELWVPGGRTSGGVIEAVVDSIPTADHFIMPSDQGGLLRYNNVRFFNLDNFCMQSWLSRRFLESVGHEVEEE